MHMSSFRVVGLERCLELLLANNWLTKKHSEMLQGFTRFYKKQESGYSSVVSPAHWMA